MKPGVNILAASGVLLTSVAVLSVPDVAWAISAQDFGLGTIQAIAEAVRAMAGAALLIAAVLAILAWAFSENGQGAGWIKRVLYAAFGLTISAQVIISITGSGT